MENQREMLTVEAMREKLSISRQAAYNLCHKPGFPVCRVGRKIIIPADRLQEWIDKGGTAHADN